MLKNLKVSQKQLKQFVGNLFSKLAQSDFNKNFKSIPKKVFCSQTHESSAYSEYSFPNGFCYNLIIEEGTARQFIQ